MLCIDAMFACSVAFLTGIDRTLPLRHCVPLKGTKGQDFIQVLKPMLRRYTHAGYKVTKINCDRQFLSIVEEIQSEFKGIDFDPTQRSQHEPVSERNNRTLASDMRSQYNLLPFKAIPKVMLKYLGMNAARHRNMFPQKGGISPYFSSYTSGVQQTFYS